MNTSSAVYRLPPPPGPRDRLFGLRLLQHIRRRPLEFFSIMARRYGDLSQVKIGPLRIALANHPELIGQVLVSQAKKFRKAPRQVDGLRQVDGEGLVVSEGEFWLRQRRLVQPAFAASRLPQFAAAAVESAEELANSWTDGQTIEAIPVFMRLACRAFSQAMFHAELDERRIAQVGEALRDLSEIITEEIGSPLVLPDWAPLPAKRRKRRAIGLLDETIRGIIARRRAGGEDQGDLLSMLLLAVDTEGDGSGMSDEQVRDEVMTMFNAGQDTTATGLVWLAHVLAQHPEVDARILEEVNRVAGNGPLGGEHLPQLKYTEQVVKEMLRLYPPTWILFAREALEDLELGGHYVRRGTWIYMLPFVTQRDERFFPDPHKFDPERFSPERIRSIPRYAWIPFGAGPHVCIGKDFALEEMKLVLAVLLQRFRFEPAAGQPAEVQYEPLLSLRPKGGLKLVIRAR